ncbi:MAG: hypothetical protein QN168_04640 [Armatimonadota bacterium]|nr:hypothetical protein [Armatimonadota bacterium]
MPGGARRGSGDAASRRWLSTGAVAIGLASFLSDLGHEMATAILPLFLLTIGGRLERRKGPAATACLVTAVATSAFALATAWWHVLVGRSVAWFGREFRSERATDADLPPDGAAPAFSIADALLLTTVHPPARTRHAAHA